jgi:hypothetical protein
LQWADLTPPPLVARNLAMVHIAIADAVDRIAPSFASNLPGNGGGRRAASIDAAVALAAHDVLTSVFPEQALAFDTHLQADLLAIPDGPAENSGVAIGRKAARRVLADRLHDGADALVAHEIRTAPGDWQPTPPSYRLMSQV